MILIADSGSTKTNWSLCASEKQVQHSKTKGINPFFMNEKEIVRLLEEEFILDTKEATSVYFYGAGCTPEKMSLVRAALREYFEMDKVTVYSDLLAAAHSLCGKGEGIVCILGTGSNSCYYDGQAIRCNVSPLGYILGDEGSGAVMGKKLIAEILNKQLSENIIRDFFNKYKFTPADIIQAVYGEPFPNRYLAQFAPFLAESISDPGIKKIVEESFEEFIVRNLLQYEQIKELPVHFTGSIAYYFKDNLKSVMAKYQLELGKILREPMPGLIQYYMNNGE